MISPKPSLAQESHSQTNSISSHNVHKSSITSDIAVSIDAGSVFACAILAMIILWILRKSQSTRKSKDRSVKMTIPNEKNLSAQLLSIVFGWRDWHEEPPLDKDRVRIRWTCQCGEELWDDFEELRPGAAEDLRKSLDIHERVKMSQSQGMTTRPAGQALPRPTGQALPQRPPQRLPAVHLAGANSAFVTAPVESGIPSTHNHRGSQGRRTTRTRLRITEWSQGDPQTENKKYLLLSISKPNDTRRLVQLDMEGINNDVQLFQKLNSIYYAHQRFLMRIVSARRIKLINFFKVFYNPSSS